MNNPRSQAVAGLVAAAIGLVVLTAIITSAVNSTTTNERLETAITKLDTATRQLETMRVRQAAMQTELDARQRGTIEARKKAANRDAELRRQLRVLALFLRRQGYDVPRLATPRAESSNRPKAPRPASPGTTEPSPRSPEPTPTCRLVPQLCGFPISIPTLLP